MEPAETERVAESIADLLDGMSADPAAREAGEDLVRVLMEFYGAGLAQMV